ncbi:hypothetical protein Ga0100231_020620 [Opitutaceae bacterium TAV4]|nr:hypothetical protein Ga0100231_020620 [Opitutaceae bacterium TAV4]RRK00451.1 hypothetical protein Ga0100230_021450 [Opitutaceae bacterium TAV3]
MILVDWLRRKRDWEQDFTPRRNERNAISLLLPLSVASVAPWRETLLSRWKIEIMLLSGSWEFLDVPLIFNS